MRKVFVNGCFDIIHRGHIELFSYARSLGDILFVGVDTDERVKFLKGDDRPFNNQHDRKYVLESIECISKVYFFESNTALENLIKEISPDIMVLGSDWEGKEVIGGKFAKELKFFKRIDGYSTTQILEYSSNRRNI